jgi:hypothetical protein
MPCIYMFDGWKVYMYFEDHLPPHVHLISATDEIKIDIYGNLIKVVKGSTRNLDMKYIVRLLEKNKEILEHNWKMSQEGGEFLNLKGV